MIEKIEHKTDYFDIIEYVQIIKIQGKIIVRFRDTLQSALDNKIVTLDDAKIEYEYEEIQVYRGITRKDKTPSVLNENDFLSQMEKSKKARGTKVDLSSYSCSVFTDIKNLERALYFPKPTKFIAESKISSDTNYFGPIGRDGTSHIDLWLEANAKPWETFQYLLQEESK